MPAWFRDHGYETVAVGKVSHHPGGLGGPDWNDPSIIEMPNSWSEQFLPSGPWQHPRGWMHGLARGEIRLKASEMDVFQAIEGDDSIYPDGPSVDKALDEMSRLAKGDKPFLLACGILRPHLPFGAPAKYLDRYKDVQLPEIPHPNKPDGKTTWHGSGEFMNYNRWGKNPNNDAEFATEVRRHYAACVSYADTHVGKLLDRLDQLKLRDNTIVVLWGDHGWHLGEHAVWGKHTLFEESLRSPMMVSFAGLPAAGKHTDAIVETLDLFPTLSKLCDLPIPDFVDGVSLQAILDDPTAAGHTAIAYHGKAMTIRDDTHRLITHATGHVELYDHRTREGETKNIAESQAAIVESLIKQIMARGLVPKLR
jgi:iduronate 2-sulfatase